MTNHFFAVMIERTRKGDAEKEYITAAGRENRPGAWRAGLEGGFGTRVIERGFQTGRLKAWKTPSRTPRGGLRYRTESRRDGMPKIKVVQRRMPALYASKGHFCFSWKLRATKLVRYLAKWRGVHSHVSVQRTGAKCL